MIRAASLLVAALLLAEVADAGTRHRSKEETPAQRGKLIAERRCASCHAIERGHASPSPRAPGFGTREMQHTAGLEGRLEALTTQGHYEMPAMNLQASEVADLLAYIESLERRE